MEILLLIFVIWFAWSSAKDYNEDDYYLYEDEDTDDYYLYEDTDDYGDHDGDGIPNYLDDDYYR